MTRLLLAELRRTATRRLVRISVVTAVGTIAFGGLLAFVTTASLPEATYQQRVRDAETRREAQQETSEACLRAAGIGRGDDISGEIADRCFAEPVRAEDPRFHRTRLNGILTGASGAIAVVAWALGASLVGAEFTSRSMTTLLTWETRRTRVLLAKTAAVLMAMALLAAVVLALVVLAMWPSLAAHGGPLRPNDPSLATLAGTLARGTGLATVAAALGLAIASIGRNTAAALGAGFAYVIVLENILGTSLQEWRRWLLLGNAIVFLSGDNNGGDVPGRTVTTAGLLLVAVAATLLASAIAVFRSRDLT